ncbi:MAG: hypothetical protein K8U03_25065 [Planctomycetia bacterium]|nr:hypothetical protein [Planctomycetia bacterium]
MKTPFFDRLRAYFLEVAAVIRGESTASKIFPNTTDNGMSRERVYAQFLKLHAPSKCNVSFGGFLFGENGEESGQLDVLITTDTTPRYDFHNRDGLGKAFSPVEGTLGVASIKAMLNKVELEDALSGMAAIPPTSSLEKRVVGFVQVKNYEDWPYKVIFASDGASLETIFHHLNAFYEANPSIPHYRRPHVIHVAGKYVIFRIVQGVSIVDKSTGKIDPLALGDFSAITENSDVVGLMSVLSELQKNATASNFIIHSYWTHLNSIQGLPPRS